MGPCLLVRGLSPVRHTCGESGLALSRSTRDHGPLGIRASSAWLRVRTLASGLALRGAATTHADGTAQPLVPPPRLRWAGVRTASYWATVGRRSVGGGSRSMHSSVRSAASSAAKQPRARSNAEGSSIVLSRHSLLRATACYGKAGESPASILRGSEKRTSVQPSGLGGTSVCSVIKVPTARNFQTVSSKLARKSLPYPHRAMSVTTLIAIASAGFVAPGSLSISTACSRPVRTLSPVALNLFGRKQAGPGDTGGDLAAVDHEDAVEISLTGGQRRKLRDQGKSLQSFAVPDVQKAVSDVQSMLASELVKLKFVSCDKKPDAQLLANELAAMTGAAVAECIGNECLLYRPPRDGQARKYAI